MKHILSSVSLLFALVLVIPMCATAASTLTFDGLNLKAIEVSVPASTGLDKVYVCYDLSGSTVKFKSTNPETKWYRYSNLGGGYAEEITEGIGFDKGWSTLNNPEGDMGYIIEDGDKRSYFWIIEYKGKRLTLKSASAAKDQECDSSTITVEGEGEPLHYVTINGQQLVLSRDIKIQYNTLSFDSSALQYIQGESENTFEYLTTDLRITPPAYCQTDFVITGDRFLKEWDWLEEISTGSVPPHAVAIITTAEQEGETGTTRSGSLSQRTRDGEEDSPAADQPNADTDGNQEEEVGSNVIPTGQSGLGGSAPAEINFRAYVTDGVLHNEWQMSANQDFDPIDYRFNQQDLDYTFMDEGTYYLRFVGSNEDGSCEAYGDVYTVTIGSSELRIPNAFSPNGDGINDEWKVGYRSLTKFECWIFDRYGKEVCHLTSADQGWDGKIGGKTAKPGVYYYVIEAQGADGKKYKKGGDINILRYVGGSKTEVPAE